MIDFSATYNYAVDTCDELWVQYDAFVLILVRANIKLITYDIERSGAYWTTRLINDNDDWNFAYHHDRH